MPDRAAKRCLIIDPSAMVRRVAARILRELGFEVVESRSALEAIDICHTTMPDVVMLDWKADGLAEPDSDEPDGSDFIGALRATAIETKAVMPAIIFCTAERSVELIVRALRAGASEYIMKPFDSDVIESKFALAGLLDPTRHAGGRDACAVP